MFVCVCEAGGDLQCAVLGICGRWVGGGTVLGTRPSGFRCLFIFRVGYRPFSRFERYLHVSLPYTSCTRNECFMRSSYGTQKLLYGAERQQRYASGCALDKLTRGPTYDVAL